jgi:hypothetical protein
MDNRSEYGTLGEWSNEYKQTTYQTFCMHKYNI